jgi:hypothetical protein
MRDPHPNRLRMARLGRWRAELKGHGSQRQTDSLGALRVALQIAVATIRIPDWDLRLKFTVAEKREILQACARWRTDAQRDEQSPLMHPCGRAASPFNLLVTE